MSYRKLHGEISTLEEGEVDLEEEMTILEQFEDSVEKNLNLLKRLLDIRVIHSQVVELDYKLEDLETKVAANPDKDYSASIPPLASSLKATEDIMSRSTIDSRHLLKG